MYSPVSLVISGVFLPLLDIVALCVRFWVRLRIQPTFVGTDDYFIMVGCALACVMGGMQIAGMRCLPCPSSTSRPNLRVSFKPPSSENSVRNLARPNIANFILSRYAMSFNEKSGRCSLVSLLKPRRPIMQRLSSKSWHTASSSSAFSSSTAVSSTLIEAFAG